MMAGTGVSGGGAGMLRARRRDVSVKPNRKLDRKSSRGMIYENEELRLRTIHINAEVEQGQNDIKKLRRENEQLRREIWSLRDEYDKLEEILKNQKSRESSEEYEDRSEGDDKDDEDDAEDGSEYSDEEDEEEECAEEEEAGTNDEDVGEGEEHDQEERLENAENQKISSEKMNSGVPHRLHVEFDDLSVVDEEEEVKRDRDRKDAVSPEDKLLNKSENDPGLVRISPRNGYTCYPPNQYGSPTPTYYPECPFTGDTGFSEILNPPPMLLTPCPTLYEGSMPSIPNFDSPLVAPHYEENLRNNRLTYGSPLGWQSNIFTPTAPFKMSESYQSGMLQASQASGMSSGSMFTLSGQSDQSAATTLSTLRAVSRAASIDERASERILASTATNNVPTLLQRRNVLLKQPNCFYDESPGRVGFEGIEGMPSSAEALTRNGWDFGTGSASNREAFCDASDRRNERDAQREKPEGGNREESGGENEEPRRTEDSGSSLTNGAASDRPKHFFAPLPTKMQHGRQDSGDKTRTANTGDSASITYSENFGTGRSSSSGRTNSTVISARYFQNGNAANGNISDGGKGSADICFNGAIPAGENEPREWSTGENRIFKSTENLLIGVGDVSPRGNNSSRQGSNNLLVKSVSCQDLTSEQLQNSLFEISKTFNGDNKSQKLTKSDNTLDNPPAGSPKPFRSQLNVTLKQPGKRDSPETPEIPKLPSIDYRLFNNRFLRSFESTRLGNYENYGVASEAMRPLSIQVNEAAQCKTTPRPSIDYSNAMLTQSFAKRLNPEEGAGRATTSATRAGGSMNEPETDRQHRVPVLQSSSAGLHKPPVNSRIISSPKLLRHEFQVTSFEQPNPRSLLPGLAAFEMDSLRRLPTPALNAPLTAPVNPLISNHQKLYQNVPFVPGAAGPVFCAPGQSAMRMFFENQAPKVQAQTQTSIDGGSNCGEESGDTAAKAANPVENQDTPGSPTSLRRKRTVRKPRSNQTTEKRPLSPAAQRRKFRKQSSVTDGTETSKTGVNVNKSRKCSLTNSTAISDHLEDKLNESRSSSSGQESPRKDHNRRVSLYFNSKKRPSLASVRTARSGSTDITKDIFAPKTGHDLLDTTNSERERTNSASSREAAGGGKRRSSISSGKVPWCACWGNGCI